jgi:signal transduction histidine kinase
MDPNSDSMVLIVDDRDASRYVTERVLRRAGFDTAEASSGEEAVALARSMKPDVVLLDINLPDIDGYEVCRRLRADESTSGAAIVQLSATFESPEYQVRGLEGGADTFLVAPVEPTVLVATVRAMLRLRRAEARLREVDRRKDEFLAMLAHELRNPLAPLFYCLDSLERPQAAGADLAATLGIMRRQTEHLRSLVDDLVDMSRITQNKLALRLAPVSLREVIDAAVEARRSELEAMQRTLTVSLPDAPVELEADRVRLAQVFGNLLSNSIQYTEQGGRIRIEADAEDEDVVVTISDDGIGILAEDLDRIFELFVQVRKPGNGLGIGLALVDRLVQMHGGSIRAASDGRGRGSTFTVRLPRRTQAARIEEATRPSGADDEPDARKVLVVDDNVDAADSMVQLLKMMNQDVRASYGGRDAIAVAGEFRPDVIFMDVTMPDMDGLESVERIRREDWSGKTLICSLSGHGQPADVARSKEAGADLHLVKPISRAQLVSVLSRSRDDTRNGAS